MTTGDSDPRADRVHQQMRDAILSGDLPEDKLLSHVALARQFGLSRIPVREALQRLVAERLVVSRPHRGREPRYSSAGGGDGGVGHTNDGSGFDQAIPPE